MANLILKLEAPSWNRYWRLVDCLLLSVGSDVKWPEMMMLPMHLLIFEPSKCKPSYFEQPFNIVVLYIDFT
jgi:hypothetical protein